MKAAAGLPEQCHPVLLVTTPTIPPETAQGVFLWQSLTNCLFLDERWMNVYLTFGKGYHKIPQSPPKSHLADRMSYCRAVPFFVTLPHKTTDYDPLEEHTDSDSFRPEVLREGSLPFPRDSPMHHLRLHPPYRATFAFYPDPYR